MVFLSSPKGISGTVSSFATVIPAKEFLVGALGVTGASGGIGQSLCKKFIELEIPYKNLIHFGLTSQDINNVSITLSIKDYITKIYKLNIINILSKLQELMNKSNIVMISSTHGQSAVPPTLKKEINVFKYRTRGPFYI